jgi:RNA polymerase subunit RPABC4/transcription elongation factor Spt4
MPFDFDLQTVSNYLLVLTAFFGAFLAALWLSLVIWTFRDMRARSRDPLAQILAALVVAVLTLPGLAVYVILRPPRTLEEAYQHTLEEEALLQEIEEKPRCPGCGRNIQESWQICPTCQSKLKKPCHNCRRLLELAWNICPYCATPVPGRRTEAPAAVSPGS